MLRKIGKKAFSLALLIPTVYLLIPGTPQLVLADITCENSDYACIYVDQTPGSTQRTVCTRSVCGPGLTHGGKTYLLEGLYAFAGGNPNTVTTTTAVTTTTTTTPGATTTATTTPSATTTTAASASSSSPRFTDLSFVYFNISENQVQAKVQLSISSMPITIPSLSISWTLTNGGSTVASGTISPYGSASVTLGSPNPFPIDPFTATGLTCGTTYSLSATGGSPGNMVSGSHSITTKTCPTTTTTVAPATTTTTVTPATTTTTTTVAPTTTTAALTTSTTSPSSVTIEPTTTSSSPSKSGNTDTTEAGSGGSSSESSSNSSVVSVSTTTTAVPNGEVRASVGGVEVEVETKVENNAVTVSVGEVTAGISNANTSDNSTNGESQQGLVLSSGESADVSIDGLQPNSEVEVVIYSTPRNLGSLQVNEFGELVASIEIPSNMESGPHTLVLKGFDKFGKQIELKFGLVVYSPDAYIPVWVWFLIGLLLILLAASLVSRKNKKVIIAT